MTTPVISVPGASPLSMPERKPQPELPKGLHTTVLVISSAEGLSLLEDSTSVLGSTVIRVPGQHWNGDI